MTADARLITELLEALERVEFSMHGKCPECLGWDGSRNGRGETPGRHAKDCVLAAAIAKAKAEGSHER